MSDNVVHPDWMEAVESFRCLGTIAWALYHFHKLLEVLFNDRANDSK